MRRTRSALLRHLGSEAGITLLESLVALAVLTIVIIGATTFTYQGRWGLDEEERKRTATQLTSRLLEERRALGYPSVLATDTSVTIDGVAYHVKIIDQQGVPSTYLRTVTDTTWWLTRKGVRRTFTVASYYPAHI